MICLDSAQRRLLCVLTLIIGGVAACLSCLSASAQAASTAQVTDAAQALTLAGLRSPTGNDRFVAGAASPDGTSLYLLENAGDGIRLLKLDAAGDTVLAQTQLGRAGDAGTALIVDGSGNLYVTGTTSSGTLQGTPGAAFPTLADTSTNSFLLHLDPDLNELFLTFLGAGRTASTAVAATADSVFVTGITFSATFPVTPSGAQQQAAAGTSENGFVERFSANGATLVYATYLTGVGGTTIPTSIAAGTDDAAYVAGSTSAPGYPTTAALVPRLLMSGAQTGSGFVSKLTAAGDGFLFSTFVPGAGINSVAVDAASQSLLLAGGVSPGQFPVSAVPRTLAAVPYLSVLRLSTDGQTVLASVPLLPGASASAVPDGQGGTWVTGIASAPLFPAVLPPLVEFGDSFALHLPAAANAGALAPIDQSARFGAVDLAAGNGVATTLAAPVVLSSGNVAFAGGVTLAATTAAASTSALDLPLLQAPTAALPDTVRTSVAACTGNCYAPAAAYLQELATGSSAAALTLSVDAQPMLTLRNAGSATADGVAITSRGFSVSTNCGTSLAPGAACGVLLGSSGPGSVTISSGNTASYTVPLPATTRSSTGLFVTPAELDFGIVTPLAAASQSFSVTNLTATASSFSSALDGQTGSGYSLGETASDCGNTHTVAAGATCRVTLQLSATGATTADASGVAAVRTAWRAAGVDVAVTAVPQPTALTLSATEIDFGTQFAGGLRVPRQLVLSNNGTAALPHSTVVLARGAVFAAGDACPAMLAPQTACLVRFDYNAAEAPSSDRQNITVDGMSVLLTGTTLAAQGVGGSAANPNITVSPASYTFATPVVVTGMSTEQIAIVVKNTGTAAAPLTISSSAEFPLTNGCPATLAGGSSCQVLVNFAPANPGARSGLLAIGSGSAFAPQYVALAGTAIAILPANNGNIDLGDTLAGEPDAIWLKVPVGLASLSVSVAGAGFGVALVPELGYGHGTLPPSAFSSSVNGSCGNCWLGVQLLGNLPGPQSGTLTLSTASNGNAYALALTGTVLPVSGLVLSPAAQDFGPVAAGSTSAASLFTFVNLLPSGDAATIQSISVSGDFVLDSGTGLPICGNGTLPYTASCTLAVDYTPTTQGEASGVLSVATDHGTFTASLAGFGLPSPGIAFTPAAVVFRNINGPGATQQAVLVTNQGTGTYTFGPAAASDPSFTVQSGCSTLAPGAACTVTVTLTPQFAITSGTLSLSATEVLDGRTLPQSFAIPLSGTYTTEDVGLSITPATVNFGTTAMGALSAGREFTLLNQSQKAVQVTLTAARQFPITASGCATLAPGASCSFSAEYLAQVGGQATGTIFATAAPTDGSATLQALAYQQAFGMGAGSLQITGAGLLPNTPLSFGQVASGQSQSQVLTLTNTSASALTVRRISTTPPFSAGTTCLSPLSPQATCTVTVSYAPSNQVGAAGTAPRQDTGSLLIESTAASSPDTLDLAGSATAQVVAAPVAAASVVTYTLSQGALAFPSTAAGNTSVPVAITLTNAGSASLHVSSITAPADFTETNNCATVVPGATCTLNVSFTPGPASAGTTRSGAVEILSDAADALGYISLVGSSSAAPLTLSPTSLDFGTVSVGTHGQLSLTVSNTLATPVTFTGLSATGDYTTASGTCPAVGGTLAGGAACEILVTFTPTAVGTRAGVLSLSSTATTAPLTVNLTGTATSSQLTATPSALAFGSINVGATGNLTLTLLNSGNASVTAIATSLSGPDASQFAVTSPCSTTSLAPNQGCTVTVSFLPTAAGSRAASLLITSSDPGSPIVVPLTGTAIVTGGSFTLSAAPTTIIVASGLTGYATLTVTPSGGFQGTVALTCTPVVAAPYANCSLLPSSLIFGGDGNAAAGTATVSLNTITTLAQSRVAGSRGLMGILLCLPLACLLFGRRRQRLPQVLAAQLCVLMSMYLGGCGGGTPPSRIRTTPAGTYSYTVTASSTTGTPASQSVTLTLVVQ